MIPSSNAFFKLKFALLQKMCLDIKSPKNIEKWSRNTFKEAAAYISKSIKNSSVINEVSKQLNGTYISASTLERVLKYGYTLPNPIDKRRLNTLNKISVYLGYKDWSAYCMKIDQLTFSNQHFNQIIQAGLNAEFEVYNDMPENTLDKLLPYFIEDGPAFKQIYHIVTKLNKKQWSLRNKNNPSYYQILDIDVVKIEEAEVHLTTHECWYLKWHCHFLNQPEKFYNANNKQLYILKKEKNIWKIYLNHYPFKSE